MMNYKRKFMDTKQFTGTGVAIVTPFKSDKSIDFQALEKQVNRLIDGGVDYLVPLGTTGEYPTMNAQERRQVVDKVLEVNNKRVPVIVGIGGNYTQAVVDTIKNYDFEGIDAILSVTPYYNKPTQNGLYEHYRAVAEAAPVGVVMYNVPGRTGAKMSAETTLRLANDFENIIATKEASADLTLASFVLKHKADDFLLISGDDALTLPLVALGASGVISVTANAVPKQFSDMVRAALKADMSKAQKLHAELIELFEAMFMEGNPACVKAALHGIGVLENELRLPLTPVCDKTYQIIADLMTQYRQ